MLADSLVILQIFWVGQRLVITLRGLETILVTTVPSVLYSPPTPLIGFLDGIWLNTALNKMLEFGLN